MTAQWSELHRRAKALEARLEGKVQKYASLAQKINADFLCDEGELHVHVGTRIATCSGCCPGIGIFVTQDWVVVLL